MKARSERDFHLPLDPKGTRAVESVVQVAEAMLPTRHGRFRIAVFQAGDSEITALLVRDTTNVIPLVRLHSECLTGDTFGSLRCDCGEQLDAALARIAHSGYGVLLYLRQEGRGIGLANKIRAYALQDAGMDTVDANIALGLPIDGRNYRAAAAVLLSMKISRVRLLTNNPNKRAALERSGVEVLEQVPLLTTPNPGNLSYLRTKARRLGHLLDLGDAEPDHSGESSP